MEQRYLTIKEFAKMTNVSPQAVYKRTKTSLKEFCREGENGKIEISIDALARFEKNSTVEQPLTTVEQPKEHSNEAKNAENHSTVEQPFSTKNSTVEQPLTALEDYINTLKEQLKQKDEQIKALSTLLENTQKTLLAEQTLHAQALLTAENTPPKPDGHNQEETPPIEKKKGFLYKLFHR